MKNSLTVLLVFILVIMLFVAVVSVLKLAGINLEFPEKKQAPTSSNAITSTPEPVVDNTIKFDVEKAKVGEKIGNMTIIKLRGYKSEQATADSAFVDFKGEVTIKGDIIYNNPERQGGELVCVQNLDKDSQGKMPKLTSQFYVSVSFCFNNLDLAKKLLIKNLNKENQGQATVTIDNYKIQWFPVEIYNTADLIAVSN